MITISKKKRATKYEKPLKIYTDFSTAIQSLVRDSKNGKFVKDSHDKKPNK